jgi:ABC-type transporter Mla subunit MlaD
MGHKEDAIAAMVAAQDRLASAAGVSAQLKDLIAGLQSFVMQVTQLVDEAAGYVQQATSGGMINNALVNIGNPRDDVIGALTKAEMSADEMNGALLNANAIATSEIQRMQGEG